MESKGPTPGFFERCLQCGIGSSGGKQIPIRPVLFLAFRFVEGRVHDYRYSSRFGHVFCLLHGFMMSLWFVWVLFQKLEVRSQPKKVTPALKDLQCVFCSFTRPLTAHVISSITIASTTIKRYSGIHTFIERCTCNPLRNQRHVFVCTQVQRVEDRFLREQQDRLTVHVFFGEEEMSQTWGYDNRMGIHAGDFFESIRSFWIWSFGLRHFFCIT